MYVYTNYVTNIATPKKLMCVSTTAPRKYSVLKLNLVAFNSTVFFNRMF